jgi:hypothetical protein
MPGYCQGLSDARARIEPVEVEPLRQRVAALIGTSAYPQLIVRVGYGAEVPPTPPPVRSVARPRGRRPRRGSTTPEAR